MPASPHPRRERRNRENDRHAEKYGDVDGLPHEAYVRPICDRPTHERAKAHDEQMISNNPSDLAARRRVQLQPLADFGRAMRHSVRHDRVSRSRQGRGVGPSITICARVFHTEKIRL